MSHDLKAAARLIVDEHPSWLEEGCQPSDPEIAAACCSDEWLQCMVEYELEKRWLRARIVENELEKRRLRARIAAAESDAVSCIMAAESRAALDRDVSRYELIRLNLSSQQSTGNSAVLLHSRNILPQALGGDSGQPPQQQSNNQQQVPRALGPDRCYKSTPSWMPAETKLPSIDTTPSYFENMITTLMKKIHEECHFEPEKNFFVTTGGIDGASRMRPDLTRFTHADYKWDTNAVSLVEIKYYRRKAKTRADNATKAIDHAIQQLAARMMSYISYLDLLVMKRVTMRCGVFTQEGFYQVEIELRTALDHVISASSVVQVSRSDVIPWPTNRKDFMSARRMAAAIEAWLYADETCATLLPRVIVDGAWTTKGLTQMWSLRRSLDKANVYVMIDAKKELLLWKEFKAPSKASALKEEQSLERLQGIPNVPQLIEAFDVDANRVILTKPVGAPLLSLKEDEFLEAGRQLLWTLGQASSRGLRFHGDPSINNIVRVKDTTFRGGFRYILIDWAEAETTNFTTDEKKSTTWATTWLYAHPSLSAAGSSDVRSWDTDAFAVVMSLIALLVGQWPSEYDRHSTIRSFQADCPAASPTMSRILQMAVEDDARGDVIPLATWSEAFAPGP